MAALKTRYRQCPPLLSNKTRRPRIALRDADCHVFQRSTDLPDDAAHRRKQTGGSLAPGCSMKYEAPDFERLEELFHALSELDAAARKEFLDANCSADPALRAALEKLLNADEKATETALLNTPRCTWKRAIWPPAATFRWIAWVLTGYSRAWAQAEWESSISPIATTGSSA